MKSFYPFVKPLHSNAFNPDRRSHIEVKDVYAGTRWFLKKLYKEYDSTFRLMYVNFLDFLENDKGIPIDDEEYPFFIVHGFTFGRKEDSLIFSRMGNVPRCEDNRVLLGNIDIEVVRVLFEFINKVDCGRNAVDFVDSISSLDIEILRYFSLL